MFAFRGNIFIFLILYLFVMGLLDSLKEKKKELENQKKDEEEQPEGKYNNPCSLCGGVGTQKKWMGQYWHKKCLRSLKKSSRKMA